MSNLKVNLIVAIDEKYGIGKNNQIPWEIKEDSLFFLDTTKTEYLNKAKNIVIYGKNTWLSFPETNRGLKDRINIIISSTITQEILNEQNTSKCEVYICDSLESSLKKIKNQDYGKIGKVFICGGKRVYEEAIKLNIVDEITLTKINQDYDCDIKIDTNLFDQLLNKDFKVEEYKFTLEDKKINKNILISFSKYSKDVNKNTEEKNYQNMLYNILKSGHYRKTRNEFTYSTFGNKLEFDLSQGFPLLTSKKVYFKGVFEELLWFLQGDTNANNLSNKNVKIWEPNTSREFLDSMNFKDREVGDMGPMYGYQWRYFGAEYKGMNFNYEGMGFDQVKYCIDLIKRDPYSRRILMTSFNPQQAKDGVLYPCHGISIIFNVEEGNKLSCMMTQRSADSFLGVKW